MPLKFRHALCAQRPQSQTPLTKRCVQAWCTVHSSTIGLAAHLRACLRRAVLAAHIAACSRACPVARDVQSTHMLHV